MMMPQKHCLGFCIFLLLLNLFKYTVLTTTILAAHGGLWHGSHHPLHTNNNKQWWWQIMALTSNSSNDAFEALFVLWYVFLFLLNSFKYTNNYNTSTSRTQWPMMWQPPPITYEWQQQQTTTNDAPDIPTAQTMPSRCCLGFGIFCSY